MASVSPDHGLAALLPPFAQSASPTLASLQREEAQRKGRIVAVEGNIGCGKSTFLNYFRKYNNVQVFEEPVDKWKDVMGYNALDMLYKDTQRWSCPFEFLVTLSLMENHRAAQGQPGVQLLERSIYSTRHCFMEYLRSQGQLHSLDHGILTDWHTWLQQDEHVHVDLIVYLRATPEVCAHRMWLRSRAEESDIPLEYLRALHELHDDWLLHRKRGELPAPVLVLDANKNLQDLQRDIDAASQDIILGHPMR
ncbi:unnamed protein product [Candidula unifasciata]|uniref:Deoxynucleoside kinase domain-containing protein n=1 Tax=Candidula unifasciata TaxID=100452 RepID=A0A8S4A3S9_9EUPU|nr:unnamed protein product [Candidula unifasciata]